jgi:hypothetical protein
MHTPGYRVKIRPVVVSTLGRYPDGIVWIVERAFKPIYVGAWWFLPRLEPSEISYRPG